MAACCGGFDKDRQYRRPSFKLRILADHVALQPMRLQVRPMPNALYGVFADVQVVSQFAARPMSGAVTGFRRVAPTPSPESSPWPSVTGYWISSRPATRCFSNRLLQFAMVDTLYPTAL